MRRAFAVVLLAALVLSGAALARAGFTDPAGDDNAAPDVTSVSVSEAADGTVTVAVAVRNYQTLPANTWFNLWFDLDNDQRTGAAGDEALVRYRSEGVLESYLWDGSELAERSTEGMTGSFAGGVLTVSLPRAAVGDATSFGVLAVAARGQPLGDDELIASDFAPDSGRSAYASPGPATFPDAGQDQDAAPDVTGVTVSDAKDGWVRFSVATPNYAALPDDAVLVVLIDADANPRTGDEGADVALGVVQGEVELNRWSARSRQWVSDTPPTRAKASAGRGVVALDVHASELGSPRRFRFSVLAADFDPASGSVLALDIAPDGGATWPYTLVNPLRLLAGRPTGVPSRPLAGKPFTVSVPVRRSDTGRPIASGRATCRVSADGTLVRARGRVAGGRAQCAFVVPAGAQAVRGSVTVVSEGAAVTARFSFRVG